MNSSFPKIKLGIVDHELNMVTFYLFCIMLCAAMFLTILKGYYSSTETSNIEHVVCHHYATEKEW